MGKQVMDLANDEPLILRGAAWTAAAGTALLGVSALIGWVLDDQLLKQFVPGLPSMRPTTALCLILLGIAVTTLIRRARRRWVGRAAMAGAGLIAGLSLLEYLLDRDLLVSGLMFANAVDREPSGGRMAVAAAVLVLLAVSALAAASRGRHQTAQWLSLVVFTGGAVAVLGYAYGERRLYATDAQAGMALNTALGLILLAIGVLAVIPDGVLSQLFRRPAPGALLSRRLLPWIMIVMPLVGWLRVEGQRQGWFGTALGAAIMVLAGSILVTITAQLAVVSMDRLSSALRHAWHQYGLATARDCARISRDPTPPPSSSTPDRITIESQEDLQISWDR